MSAIQKKLRSYSDFVAMKPASDTAIAEAEKELSVKFSGEYRDYLSVFGAAAANGHELTGVSASKRLSVVRVTKREWELNPQVPRSMYVIENTGIDGIIIWQDASGSVYKSVPHSSQKKLAASIADYLSM